MERPKKTQLAPLLFLFVVPLQCEKDSPLLSSPKGEGAHRQGQRLKTGPYTTEALPVLSISNLVLPFGGVGGGLIYHA